ncbi:hypothetical protein J437_LFUL005009 [Ladona fulva]|uniref:Ig-like domain-containing protein n=1 Tax=Ladona fulva TaxID=123851 RepID=A0A8K0JUQ3_LADFU|nr:hypothetical protein J437_LFUL005009 [Ladona fulva]
MPATLEPSLSGNAPESSGAVASPLLLADVNHGPSFIAEPPHRVEFSNGSGGRVDCWATGRPAPVLEWLLADGTVATPVPRLRIPQPNGSLVFPPFPAERYRHDVHAALYRCRAHSAQGTVLSRDVHVRAGELLLFYWCSSIDLCFNRRSLTRESHSSTVMSLIYTFDRIF